jgi:hypothetical protein
LYLKGSSDEFIDANIQLALATVRKVKELKGISSCIVSCNTAIMPPKYFLLSLFQTSELDLSVLYFELQVFPDQPEKRRGSQLFGAALDAVHIRYSN